MVLKYRMDVAFNGETSNPYDGITFANVQWVFVDEIQSASYSIVFKEPQDSDSRQTRGVKVHCVMGHSREEHHYCWDEAYLISNDGKTIERLN